MSNPTMDAGIPVLTEIIPATPPSASAPATPAPMPMPTATPAPAAARLQDEAVSLQKRAVDEWDEEKWNRLEREIRERILHQVLERIDFVLEERVRDSLADVLQTAVERLASEIKSGLHATMNEVVTRAVAHEISRLQATKK
jgi:hypothetical protein